MKKTVSTLGSLALTTALVAAGAAATMTPADASSAAAKYRVTLQVSSNDVVADQDELVLTGRVYPTPGAGSKVTVQLQYEGKDSWKSIGTAKVNKKGKFTYTDEPTSSQERSYRVVKKGDGNGAKGISRERAVEVSAWQWLDERSTSAGANIVSAYSMPINGDDYRHTLHLDKAYDTGFIEWTLGRKCTELEATLGLSDRTETGGRGSVLVTNDGTPSYSRLFNLGESQLVSIPVTDVYRLRIDMAQDVTTPDTEPSAGAARVLCD